LQSLKSDFIEKRIFSNGGIEIFPCNSKKVKLSYLDEDLKVANLITYELEKRPIRFVKTLSKGWSAVVSIETVTFLRPDMDQNSETFSIPNIDAISEYVVKKTE
jgi:hypothetical protein